MAFLVSPGIDIQEVDLTNIVPATSTSVGAYAGHFNWGPVDEMVTIGSEKELVAAYGSPAQGDTTRSFLTAASFLKYSNSLRVSRAIGSSALNAADSNPILIKNKDIFDTLTGLNFIFSAKYPGKIGNSLTVSYAHVSGVADSSYNSWEFKGLFDSAPNKSLTAIANGVTTNDEIHLVVIDTLGLISGTKGAVLEKYEGLSLGANAKNEDGASIFYKDVLNTNSSYIYVNTLSDTFADADEDITSASVFAVAATSVESISDIELPFLLETSTTVTYSGGASVTTTVNTEKIVTIKSGYDGANGNNVKLNIRYLAKGDAPATVAHGFIKFGVPVNGDTVSVGGTTFTKASSATGLNYATASDLAGLISNVTDINATVVGDHINIVSEVTGTAGNSVVLALGNSNTGTQTISGSTLKGGLAVDSLSYVDVTVDTLSAATGYVTYDVSISTELASGVNTTDVTLADIINEIAYKSALVTDAGFQTLSFEIDGDVVTGVSPIASMLFDVETVLPYTVSDQVAIEIFQFTGGEVVTYNNNTLINTYNLLSGADGSISPGNVATALDLFVDKELVDINFLFAEAFNTSQETVDVKIYEVANNRKDIVGFISAPIGIAQLTSNTLKKQAVIAKFDGVAYTSSSYIVFDETPVYTYNKYADKYVWIPAAGHVAGLCANADFVADPWFSPAGFNRGQLKGVTKIAYNPTQTDRDDLYKKRINAISSIPGEGVVLRGDKTALSKPSAFDRINVRRLFNVLERAISNASKYQLFELNDEFTRASFKNTIEPFLRDVQGRRGIIDFKVVCDETNNTPQVIDGNEFVGDIYIKPARSINFIRLNFIATRTGVDFREIVGA
jgi:hypothetical protein